MRWKWKIGREAGPIRTHSEIEVAEARVPFPQAAHTSLEAKGELRGTNSLFFFFSFLIRPTF